MQGKIERRKQSAANGRKVGPQGEALALSKERSILEVVSILSSILTPKCALQRDIEQVLIRYSFQKGQYSYASSSPVFKGPVC